MSGQATVRTMRPRPLFALAALCACMLVALLAVEYHSGVIREQRAVRIASPGIAPDAAGGGTPGADGAAPSLSPGPVQDWTRMILARPLFSPSRRPPSVAVSGPERPRLAGIILGPSGRRAIFAGNGTARGVVAGVGQNAGAWHVLAIDQSGVRVMGPDGQRLLRPSRDPSASSADAAPPLPEHPSILDLLRNRNLPPPGAADGAAVMPTLPPVLRNLAQPPQPTSPANSE